MGFLLKIVLIIMAVGGVGVGKIGLAGTTPESIAVGVVGVLVALFSIIFFLRFLWRFLGCFSVIIISTIIVVILLILTGGFDKVTAKVHTLVGGHAEDVQVVSGNDGALPSEEYIPVTQYDGTMVYVPVSMLSEQEQESASVAVRSSNQFVGSISWIRSGNQFTVDDLRVVLFGIDTPDPDQTCSDRRGRPYNCGQESIRQLKRFTGATPLNCKVMGRGQSDVPLVFAVCNIRNNDVGVAMVTAGWAFAKPNETKVYVPYEAVARNSRSGMWAGQFYMPSDWRQMKQMRYGSTVGESSGAMASMVNKAKSLFSGLFK